MNVRRSRLVTAAALGVFLCATVGLWRWCITVPHVAAAEPDAKASKEAVSQEIKVEPLPDWYKFQSAKTVQGWIDDLDNKAITAHAWDTWGALTTMTNQKSNGELLPVFDTWWDKSEVFAPPGVRAALGRQIHRFEPPAQFRRSAALRAKAASSGHQFGQLGFDTVKYNDAVKKHVDDKHYNDQKVLAALNDGWPANTPLANRKVVDFPDESVMLKPTYRFVSGTSPTITGYWAGPSNSTSPSTPSDSTWTKKMLVVPPESKLTAEQLTLQTEAGPLPVVKVSDFYHVKLTADEAAGLNAKSKGLNLKAGDYALLVAMHVSTREIADWTWQTFWWSFNKPSIPQASQAHIKAPFDHYQVAVGYSFTTAPSNPDSLTLTCYNPYLEAGFGNDVFARPGQLGIESNCMSCHRAAAWGPNANYVANGVIDPGDPQFFTGNTKTDFLWGLADTFVPPTPPASDPGK
jgi:hypothetical protein